MTVRKRGHGKRRIVDDEEQNAENENETEKDQTHAHQQDKAAAVGWYSRSLGHVLIF